MIRGAHADAMKAVKRFRGCTAAALCLSLRRYTQHSSFSSKCSLECCTLRRRGHGDHREKQREMMNVLDETRTFRSSFRMALATRRANHGISFLRVLCDLCASVLGLNVDQLFR